MTLFRDEEIRAESAALVQRHSAVIRQAQLGDGQLRSLQAEKLVGILQIAADAPLYADSLHQWRDPGFLAWARQLPASAVLGEILPALPMLPREELRRRATEVFTRPTDSFLHYFESSGTTGDPVAAPKAIDDLIVNTMNIGEMWGRLLGEGDVALILINGPFAPAGYQFEKVLEYLGVMSTRLWADNVTGDYARILRTVREISANVYVGTASRLLELLHYVSRSGEPAPRFDHLMLMAEQTGPALRRHLERLTGATAHVASFGSSETGTTAASCELGQLHLQLQSFVLELLDEKGARLIDGSADVGELVVTTLDLPGRPLIRYRTGDLIEITGVPCACTVALPTVRTVGRIQDGIALPDGSHRRQDEVEAALWGFGEDRPGYALNYLLVRRRPNVTCLVTTDREVDAAWRQATERRMGGLFPGHRFELRILDALPRLASLGSYVGWKMSHVLDLDDPGLRDRMPDPFGSIVDDTMKFLYDMAGAPSALS